LNINTKDLSIVILISVAGLIYITLVNPLRALCAGIPCSRYVFSFGNMILISLALLLYRGKRWRFLLQGILIALLTLPLNGGSINFTIISGGALIIVNSLHGDIIFNSFYDFFKSRKKLKHWAIISTTQFYIMAILLNIINFYLFFSTIELMAYFNSLLLIVPLVIIECYLGAEIGFRVFQRIKTQESFDYKQFQ